MLLGAALASPAARAETHGVLIGVANYDSPAVPDLVGPANDLKAMESLLHETGANDLVVLKDAAATRTSIETAIQQVGLRAKPGDWVVLYYSGHGAEAARRAGAGQGGEKDQFVLLPGFDPDRQDPERFVVDKDFYAWLARYVPAETKILMVVDSCHSGTMHRAIDPRSFAFTARLAFRGSAERAIELVARPGPRLPPIAGRGDLAGPDAARTELLPNLIYVGAAQDDQLALETDLPREGSPRRGVLTYALEQGLRGPGSDPGHLAADVDGDGHVSILELASYLGGQVRMLSAQRQESATEFPDRWLELPLFEELPPPRPGGDDGLPAVSVVDPGEARPQPAESDPWRVSPSSDEADFQWNLAQGSVVRRTGDVVATGVKGAAAFAGVMDKWRAIAALTPLVSEIALRLMLDPSGEDYIYPEGTPIRLRLAPPRRGTRSAAARYATVLDLASDGTVQLLYPLASDGIGRLPGDGTLTVLDSKVVPPFGTDHVVVVTTPTEPAALRALARSLDGRRGASALIGAVRSTLRDARGAGSLSIAELYTGQ